MEKKRQLIELVGDQNPSSEAPSRLRLGWVKMAVGIPEGPSHPGHSGETLFLLCCPLNHRRRATHSFSKIGRRSSPFSCLFYARLRLLIFLLLLMSGNVHPNPGPIFPCSVFTGNVAWRGKSVQCCTSSKWVHLRCSLLSLSKYLIGKYLKEVRKYLIGSSPLTSSFSMTLTYLPFSIGPLAVAPPPTYPLIPPLMPFLANGRCFNTWILITYQFFYLPFLFGLSPVPSSLWSLPSWNPPSFTVESTLCSPCSHSDLPLSPRCDFRSP